jgi:branched-subunit amino acid ABC-type transport system permease component
MEWSILILNLVHGFLWGTILGATAIGLSLLWGVMKVVNVAHGETLLLGSYLIIMLYTALGLSPYIGLVAALALGLVVGLGIYWALLHKIIGKVEIVTLKVEMSTLLIMFALSVILSNSYYHFIGSEPKGLGLWHFTSVSSIRLGPVPIRTNSILAVILAFVIVISLHLLLKKTMLGKSINAVMQDAQAAALVGIDPVKVKMLTASLAIGVTTLSGFLVIMHETAITPGSALIYTPMAFVVVVLGGLGNIIGAFIGGIIIGTVYGFSKAVIAAYYTPLASAPLSLAISFTVLIIVLLLKPEGLFGGKGR